MANKQNKLKWKKTGANWISNNGYCEFSIHPALIKGSWTLDKHHMGVKSIACFNKLSSAKKVAQLINNG